MQELHNVKGSRKNGIYVDCKQLAMRLYKLSFTMAKRDRVIFGDRMLCSLNTYCGIFKGHNNRRHLELFREEGLRRLGKYVKWNESKKCFNLVRNFNDYLISRYAGMKAV
jgi:hypothetical protein